MIAHLEKYRRLRIGFIGAGQLAVPLAMSLANAGYLVVGAASRSQASAENLSSGIADARAFDDAQSLANASDLVVIAVPDDAIAPVTRSLAWQKRRSRLRRSRVRRSAASIRCRHSPMPRPP